MQEELKDLTEVVLGEAKLVVGLKQVTTTACNQASSYHHVSGTFKYGAILCLIAVVICTDVLNISSLSALYVPRTSCNVIQSIPSMTERL